MSAFLRQIGYPSIDQVTREENGKMGSNSPKNKKENPPAWKDAKIWEKYNNPSWCKYLKTRSIKDEGKISQKSKVKTDNLDATTKYCVEDGHTESPRMSPQLVQHSGVTDSVIHQKRGLWVCSNNRNEMLRTISSIQTDECHRNSSNRTENSYEYKVHGALVCTFPEGNGSSARNIQRSHSNDIGKSVNEAYAQTLISR